MGAPASRRRRQFSGGLRRVDQTGDGEASRLGRASGRGKEGRGDVRGPAQGVRGGAVQLLVHLVRPRPVLNEDVRAVMIVCGGSLYLLHTLQANPAAVSRPGSLNPRPQPSSSSVL